MMKGVTWGEFKKMVDEDGKIGDDTPLSQIVMGSDKLNFLLERYPHNMMNFNSEDNSRLYLTYIQFRLE